MVFSGSILLSTYADICANSALAERLPPSHTASGARAALIVACAYAATSVACPGSGMLRTSANMALARLPKAIAKWGATSKAAP
jgi:hypothetical protein